MTKKKEHPELNFCLKVFRNAVILSGLYFVSVWAATNTLTFEAMKPLAIFGIGYIFTELANRYGLKPILPTKSTTKATLVL